MIDYSNDVAVSEGPDVTDDGDDPLVAAGVQEEDETEEPEPTDASVLEETLAKIPPVNLIFDERAEEIHPALFLATMVQRVLAATPVNRHKEARLRLKHAPHETAEAPQPAGD